MNLRVLVKGRLPPRVSDLSEPPTTLYLHGELPGGPAVAIVGTRHPTFDGERFARHLAGALAAEGVAILSGGAKGIDTAAHQGALDVGGYTLVVAPSGFDHPYPEENAELYRQIIERGGGFLSMEPPEVPATNDRFFPRNRLMVALAHALIVAEAPYRSGAANAAKHARELGRPIFAVMHSPWNPRGTGAAGLLELGARPFTTARAVLRTLERMGLRTVAKPVAPRPCSPPAPPPAYAPPPARSAPRSAAPPPVPAREGVPVGLDPNERAVLEAGNLGATHPDEIAAKTGLSVADVMRALLTLGLKGVLVATPSSPVTRLTRRKH